MHFIKAIPIQVNVKVVGDIHISVIQEAREYLYINAFVGIGFVPDFMAEEALAHGEVNQLALTETLPEREIILVDDRSRPQSIAVQKLTK